ncbi:hypothetical protein M3J09_010239 [Ascochyta lentis]
MAVYRLWSPTQQLNESTSLDYSNFLLLDFFSLSASNSLFSWMTRLRSILIASV